MVSANHIMCSILTVLRFGTRSILVYCEAAPKEIDKNPEFIFANLSTAKCLPIEHADSTQFSHIPVYFNFKWINRETS